MAEEGSGFAAAQVTLRDSPDGIREEFGFYGDMSLAGKLDLGIDLNQSASTSGHALIFVRLPLHQPTRGLRFSAEMALGGSHVEGDWEAMWRVKISAGGNFEKSRWIDWANLDLSHEKRGHSAHGLWKLDLSLGKHLPGRLSPMLQIETSKGPGQDFSYSIIPALRIKLGTVTPSAPKEMVLGLEYKNAQTESLGLRIAYWHRF